MRVHLAASLLAIVAAGGCYASAGYSAGYVAPPPPPPPTYTATATVSVDTSYEPDLVDVGGGVRVIADYDEPIFYTDNFYWRFYGGTWYRSSVYNGGWVVYNDVPYSVRRIDRPHAYVRYRPSGYVPRAQRRGPYERDRRYYDNRGYDRREPAPVVRDHRSPDRGYERPAPAPAPVVRDHRSPDRGYERPAPAPAPVVRDHRSDPGPARDTRPAPAPAPVVRDHREEKREEKREERREERREEPRVRDHRR